MPEENQQKYERILFGLKIKELRLERKMSFAELSLASGLSVSYLNEIEKGKKNPKAEKRKLLFRALGLPESGFQLELNNPVISLLKSNFLSELPLDIYGLDLPKLLEVIAFSPVRVNAFISTLIEISKNYNLKEENFYFSALRSYLEIHSNYFKEIEETAHEFLKNHPQSTSFQKILESEMGVSIEPGGLDRFPEFNGLRSVFIISKNKLLTSSTLTPLQLSFECGKELGFRILQLKERSFTSSILKGQSFEEVLNHSKAIYFSVAIHLPLTEFNRQTEFFFKQTSWNSDEFLMFFKNFEVSPEMFFQRLTNVIPEFFGIRKLFFLRIIHAQGKDNIDKVLHLNTKHFLMHLSSSEHYCQRFLPISILKSKNRNSQVLIQRSKFIGLEEEFLTFSMVIPSNNPVSLSLAIQLTEEAKNKIHFWNDPDIPVVYVNRSCERCLELNCQERIAEPVLEQKKKALKDIELKLKELNFQN